LAGWLPVIAMLATILAACGVAGITQTSQTQRYAVQLTLDSLRFGQRTAMIEVRDSGGQPVAADQVVLSPVMQQMGMASPEVVAQPVAPGRYQAQGEFFSMLGQWEVDVRVSAGGAEDVARSVVPAVQTLAASSFDQMGEGAQPRSCRNFTKSRQATCCCLARIAHTLAWRAAMCYGSGL
jgi:hypothetical protein